MTCPSCGGPPSDMTAPNCQWCGRALFLPTLLEVTTFGDSAPRYLKAVFSTHSAAFTNSTGPR